MTIGVTLNDKHCFDDYGMWLTNVDISQPEVQTHYVQVPGRDGELDLTEALTGDVRYYNGTTTLTFQTAEKVCGRSWFEQLEMIREDLHGQRATFLFDGTNIEYSARCEVSGTPVAGGIYEITVTATVDAYEEVPPFAFYSADDNSLNFQCGHLPEVGDKYKGKTVTYLYDSLESTGTSNPPWYSRRSDVEVVNINTSFSVARPTSCYRWFYAFLGAEFSGVENLNTSSATDMSYMFYSCAKATSLNVSNFDTSKVTDMSYMFGSCSRLTSLNVSGFDTSNVTNMGSMFYDCLGLTSLNVGNFDTSKVTSMASMFYGCSGLTTLDVSGFDTAKVTSMTSMFCGCSDLVTIYSDDDVFVTSAVTSGGTMFTSCPSLVGGNGTKYSSSNVTYTYAHVDTESNPGYFTQR